MESQLKNETDFRKHETQFRRCKFKLERIKLEMERMGLNSNAACDSVKQTNKRIVYLCSPTYFPVIQNETIDYAIA